MNRFAFALHANSNQLSSISQVRWIYSALGVRVLWLNIIWREKKQPTLESSKYPSLIDSVKDSCWHILFIALASNRHSLQFLFQYAWSCDINEWEPFQWSQLSHVCKYAFIYATIFFVGPFRLRSLVPALPSATILLPIYLSFHIYLFITRTPKLIDVMGIWSKCLVNYVFKCWG